MKLRLTKPNGVVFHTPEEHMPNIVLELSGGGYTEASTRSAMLSSDKLRSGEEININGWKLQLVGN